MVPEIIANAYLVLEGEKPRHGGHSSVRKAVSLTSGDPVAIKFIVGRGTEMTESIFQREVKVLKTARHKNIVPLLNSGIDDTSTPYLVMPWVERNLQEWIEDGNFADARESVGSLLLPLASAVGHLHRHRLEHRDIKPLNILMTSDGVPLLADMSISKQTMMTNSSGLTLQAWRTAPFAPPELVDKQPYVRDVYSLAATFVVAASDKKIENHAEVVAALDSLDCPSAVRSVLEQSLDVDPEARQADCSIMESELQYAFDHSTRSYSSRRLLFLVLTKSAIRTLSEVFPDPGQSTSFVIDDLASATVARLGEGPDGSPKVELAGDRGLYRCSPKPKEGILLVTGVSVDELEALEWLRRSGRVVASDVDFSDRTPLDKERAISQLSGFLTDLRDHNESPRDASSLGGLATHLARWTRTLDVIVEFERRKRRNIRFDNGANDGRDLTVALCESVEEDLVGSEWILKTSSDSLSGTRVEVIRHVDHSSTLRSRSGQPLRGYRRGVLEPDLGPTLVSLRRQMDALASLKHGSATNDCLGEILDGIEQAPLPPVTPEGGWFQHLDAAKQRAVGTALAGNPVMLVKGPPGTGKTRLIAEIVAQELRKSPTSRILLVSQTHVAVDNALARIASLGIDRVVRLGKPNDERISPESRRLLLDTLIDEWVQQARRRSEKHLEDLSEQVGLPATTVRAAFILQQIAAISQLIARQRERDVTSILDEIAEDSGLAVQSDQSVDVAAQESLVVQLWNDLDHLLPGSLVSYESHGPDQLRQVSKEMIAGFAEGAHLLKLVELQADWLQRMPIDPSIVATFLADATVIGGTCLGFLSHAAAKDLEFDLCIVDEASKATATEALVPVVRSQRVVLVGDPSQLPPMEEEASRDRELLEEFGTTPQELSETLYDVLSEILPESLVIELNEQFRMQKAIGDLVSECFYDSNLTSATQAPSVNLSNLWSPLLWVSTSSRKDRLEQEDKSAQRSYANRREALEIAALLNVLQRSLERGLVQLTGNQQLEVLVIAPYRSQLEAIRRELVKSQYSFNVSVESVDAVQGREADITFFSVTRSNLNGRFGFIGKKYWRRINVAVSRSRLGLIIVGDLDFATSAEGPLKKIANYMQRNPESAEVREIG